MARASPTEDRPGGAAPTGPMNAPPAKPIDGRLAVWIPRAATIGCMGLTYWLASRNEGLRGVHALVFPFFGSDVTSRSQASYLVSNLISPVLIWTVEANLEGTSMAKLALQSLVGAAVQISGIERIAPIYYLLSIATWDFQSSAEGQNIPPEVAKAVLPATLLGYVLPAALTSLVPLTATGVSQSHFSIQSSVVYSFFLAPVTVPVLTTLISRVLSYLHRKFDLVGQVDKATPEARRSSQSRDSVDALRSLRQAYAVAFAIQAVQHICTITRNIIQTPGGQRSLSDAVGSLLTYPMVPGHKYSSIALYADATLSFGLYTVCDLRRRGTITKTDTMRSSIGVLAGQVLFGPGATYAGLWWWREGVLAKNATSGMRTI